ncbi:MAG: SRPBCC family protein [Dehalococcoidia bacterium]|nr:SRPBCC family protein [Dehalococcoidia bacterium]
MSRTRSALALTFGPLTLGWAALYYFGRTWGSTRDERRAVLHGDALVPRPDSVTDHATTIDAPPEAVWPWLQQVGWHRGGWYTARWVDRLLFPANQPAAEALLPEYSAGLRVGDHVPDGPPESGCFFHVEVVEPHRLLVLRSTTHLPRKLLDDPRVDLNWTWTFHLQPLEGERTRFHFRVRMSARPRWIVWVFKAFLVPADFVMARSMCAGLKRRAERQARVASDEPHSA